MTAANPAPESAVADPARLAAIGQFLFREADLLDDWRLDDWLALVTDDIIYRVPSPGFESGAPATTMQIVQDDHQRLAGRITRLKSKHAHAESPKSHTRRIIGNVRATETEGVLRVRSNFHVLRTRLGQLDHFVGHYLHVLVPVEDDPADFRIRERVATLDHGLIEAGGTVSILL